MKSLVFALIFIFSGALLSLEQAWVVKEEVKINSKIILRQTIVTKEVLKTIKDSEEGKTETILDLANDKIVIINHSKKEYQKLVLSQYIKFVEQMAEGLRQHSNFKVGELDKNITYHFEGNETVGKWETSRYKVKLNGKESMTVWVAKSLKDSEILTFRKRFDNILPETLSIYKSVDDKIKDHFTNIGMIVKMDKKPYNKQLPKVSETVVDFEKIITTPKTFSIPKTYSNKDSSNKSAELYLK